VEFDIVPVDVDERRRPGESASVYVTRLAVDKASAVATTVDGQVVVGADTTVLIAGTILGKPQDPGEAAAMLRRLSGCTHEVLTGVAVRCGATCLTGVEVTRVSFAELEDDVIAWYVDTGEPLDKAGAYGAQGVGSRFVTRIEGSFTNVVGLPVPLVDRLLSSPQLTVP
jgi:septum formation protein